MASTDWLGAPPRIRKLMRTTETFGETLDRLARERLAILKHASSGSPLVYGIERDYDTIEAYLASIGRKDVL